MTGPPKGLFLEGYMVPLFRISADLSYGRSSLAIKAFSVAIADDCVIFPMYPLFIEKQQMLPAETTE